MTTGAKIGIWVTIAVAGIATGVGIYFLTKPKEGQKKSKGGKNYIFSEGKWVEIFPETKLTPPDLGNFTSPQNTTTPKYPSSGNDKVWQLQTKLNFMGANLVVDGIMGANTQAAMAKYHLDINGNTTSGGSTTSQNVTQTIVAPYKMLPLYTGSSSTTLYAEQSLGIPNIHDSIGFNKPDQFIGIVDGVYTLKNTVGFDTSVGYIRTYYNNKYYYVVNNNVYSIRNS